MQLINPMEWIANRVGSLIPVRPPVVYVAHPVGAQPGEVLATCTECGARNTFAQGDTLDLRLVCHHDDPVKHTQDPHAIIAFNIERALRWWRWLHIGFPEVVWTMPWYAGVIASDDTVPELRERGLRDNCEVARRCDALMACGPRISSGIRREGTALHEVGAELFQIEGINREPPRVHSARSVPWRRWVP